MCDATVTSTGIVDRVHLCRLQLYTCIVHCTYMLYPYRYEQILLAKGLQNLAMNFLVFEQIETFLMYIGGCALPCADLRGWVRELGCVY